MKPIYRPGMIVVFSDVIEMVMKDIDDKYYYSSGVLKNPSPVVAIKLAQDEVYSNIFVEADDID